MMRKLLSSLRLIEPDPYLTAVPFKEPPQRLYGTLKRDVYQLVMIGVMLLLALSLLLNLNLLLKPTQLPNLPDTFSMALLNTCNTFNESALPLTDWENKADMEQSANLADGHSIYLSEKYARVDDSKKKTAAAAVNSTIYASSRTVGVRMAIIGSSGYIGSRLLSHLRAAGVHSVIGFDKVHAGRSSSEISDDDLHSFHIVLYLGGITTRKVCADNGEKCKRENVDDIRTLAKRMKDTQTLIFASTLAINDAKPGQQNWNPVPETMPASKAADRLALSMFQREAELRRLSQGSHSPKFIGLRFGKVIGLSPNQRTNFVYDSMICSAFTNGRIPLLHDEAVNTIPVLSILWMDDLVRAVQTLVDRVEDVSERFQLFRLESYSMTAVQLANQIAAHTSAIIDGSDADGGMMKHMIVSPEGNFPADLSDFSTRFEFEFQGSSCAVIHQLMKEAPRICMARSTSLRATAIASSEKESMPCAVCGHRHMTQVLDLDRHPLPSQFRTNKSEAENLETFPLKLMRCKKCHHAQLSSFVERKSKLASYSTLDGHQSGMNKYLQFATYFCDKVVSEKVTLLRHHGAVVEIGPVDQQLLDHFLQRGWSTHVVTDTPLSGESRHTIHIGNWGVDDFSALPRGENVDAILVQDVFSHIRDPVQFLKTTRGAMGGHTKLYIRLSRCNLFDTAEFDAISHERLSYFTAHSMQRAAQLSGLRIIEFDRLPESLKDTSDSCLLTLQADANVQHDVALLPAESGEVHVHDPIQFALLKEREYGISDPFFYLKFESKIQTIRNWLTQQLVELAASHFTIVGYGADANGMTLLHALLPSSKTDGSEWEFSYFVDDAPLRQGAFVPGTSIPIKSTSALSQHDFERSNLAIVVMRWDNTEEIVKNIVEMVRPNRDRVLYAITPFPTQRVMFVDAQAQMHIDAERKASGRDYVPNTNELMDPTELNGNTPRALPYPVLRQNIQKAIPWPTVFRPRRKVYILVHMYNEELLLPYFIRHHAPIVDGAILVDYHSNDRSLAIIEQQAPASWKYVTSINKGFDSASCDQEIMAYEREIGDNWKIVLTLTEFLVHANLREWLYTIERTQPHIEAVRFQHFVMAGSDRKPLKYIPSLLTQRSEYALVPASVDSGSSYSRFLHRCTKCSYSIGRHNLFGTEWRWADDGFISKYMWTPWPNILPRKLAVGVQLSPSDIAKGYGVQHSRNERQMEETRLKDLEGGSDSFSNIRPITRKVGSASAHRTWFDYTRGH